jgi:Ca2+/H+ antiporter
VVAHGAGEPSGTLVLALAVTVIETALIVPSRSQMLGEEGVVRKILPVLARFCIASVG